MKQDEDVRYNKNLITIGMYLKKKMLSNFYFSFI